MLGKVWSQVGSVPAVDPTGTQDLAPVRPSGEWTQVTWPQTFGPAGSGSFLGPLLPALWPRGLISALTVFSACAYQDDG